MIAGMTTAEIISELHDWAEVNGPGSLANLLEEAADRLSFFSETTSALLHKLTAALERKNNGQP